MKEIMVKDLNNVSVLYTENGWNVIYNELRNRGIAGSTECVTIDFKGIEIIDPCKYNSFKKILECGNIGMRFYNAEEIVRQIKIMCIMDGLEADKIESIKQEREVKISNTEKRVIAASSGMEEIIEIDADKVLRVGLNKKYSQLMDPYTAMALEYVIENKINSDKVADVIIVLGNLNVMDRVIEIMVDMKNKFNKEYGIDVAFDTDNEKVIESLNLTLHKKSSEEIGDTEKERELSSIGVGTAGMLIKYKKSRAIDRFGRHGNGEVSSCRVCIYKGIRSVVNHDGEKKKYAKFTVFLGNTFYTRNHWALENDGEWLDNLKSLEECIPLEELGITDKVIGSDYHFCMPIQEREEDTIEMYDMKMDGKLIAQKYTLPERIKAVFDNYDIEYNKDKLEEAIHDTNMILKRRNNG